MEFMGNDGHALSLPILCGFASVSHTVACARTNKSECLSENEIFDSLKPGRENPALVFSLTYHKEIQKHDNTQDDPVISKWLEIVFFDKIHQKPDRKQRYHKRHNQSGQQNRQLHPSK